MTRMQRPSVTVYITSHNYACYLSEAVDSVLRQSLASWELIIIDDGSVDESWMIAQRYRDAWPNRIRVLRNDQSKGLRACANEVIRLARGRYIMRLDADDYLDENALLVLAEYLDQHSDCALVFPNWTYISEDGGFLGIERRRVLGREVNVLDLPPHGACTMVRRRVIKTVGGYDPVHDSQDGHELWLKIITSYSVGNVETPLFFYRQHGDSLSRDEGRLLAARQKIKQSQAARQKGVIHPNVVAIIPVRNKGGTLSGMALEPFADIPLIDMTLTAAKDSGIFDTIYVSTDDEAVVEHCRPIDGVLSEMRDMKLSALRAKLAEVLESAVNQLEQVHNIYPDIIVLLSIHSPLRGPEHIREAVDTLLLYHVDHVISVYEDKDPHFRHGLNGIEPLNPGALKELRFEREALLVDNGAVHALWRDYIDGDDLYSGKLGHVVMPRCYSLQLKNTEDIPLIKAVMEQEKAEKVTANKKGAK